MKNILLASFLVFGLSTIFYLIHEDEKRFREQQEIFLRHWVDKYQTHVNEAFFSQINTLKTATAFMLETPELSKEGVAPHEKAVLEMHSSMKGLKFIKKDEREDEGGLGKGLGKERDHGSHTMVGLKSPEVDFQIPPLKKGEASTIRLELLVEKDGKKLGHMIGEYDLKMLLREALADISEEGGPHFSIGDGRGRYFYGRPTSGLTTRVATIRVANLEWELSQQWQVELGPLLTVKRVVLIVFAFVISLATVVCFWWSYKLDTAIQKRSDEFKELKAKLQQEKAAQREISSDFMSGEGRYRTLFDYNPIQTIVVDEQAKIVMFNFANVKIDGNLPVIGAVMYKDYAKMHKLDMYKELCLCIEKGELKEFSELRYKDRFLRVNISPFSGGAIITSVDITSTKLMTDQLQQKHKMEAIGTLAGGIAHDFNNILGVIMGNAELAGDDIPRENPAHESLGEIELACTRARDVVKQLLCFSRRSEPVNQSLNVATITEETLKLLRASIPKSVDITSFIPQKLDTIRGNISQVQQVIINLCTNAANSMEEMGGVLSVNLRNRVLEADLYAGYQDIKKGRYVELEVSDTGHGIRADIREKIFDPYFTTREIGKGSGMGLSVVLGILKGHGAYIWVDSIEGKGTMVKVLYPSVQSVVMEVPKEKFVLKGGSESILYVDDEVSLLRTGKGFLEKYGYRVDTFVNPLEALKAFRKNPNGYDMVVSDISMPHKSGDKLVGELLALRRDLPIILCSGYNERWGEKEVLTLGVKKFVEKPYEIKYLASVIRKVLDRHYQG